MKSRLFLTVLAGYLLVIVLGSAGVFLSFRQAADREFRRYILDTQNISAARAGAFVEEYVKRTGSFKGLQQLLDSQVPEPRQGAADRQMMGRRMMGPGRFVVTDPGLRVIADSSGQFQPGQTLSRPNKPSVQNSLMKSAVPITENGTVLAYVFPALSVDPRLPPEDLRVLQTIQQGAFLSLLLVIAASFAAAVFLTLHIVRPIHAIGGVVAEIRKGNYAARTVLKRKDEIGGLGDGINEMAASLDDARQWRSQLISDTAHELRTPVSLLAGRLEMLSEGLYQPNQEELSKLTGEVRRLSGLIEQLEHLSELDHGDTVLEYETFDVSSLIAGRVETFGSEYARKGIALSTDAGGTDAGGPVLIRGDKGRLTQVIDNLLSNALRYTPERGAVRVSVLPGKGGGIEFHVEDSGPGIPAELREKVFRRYFRVDKSRSSQEGGRGLGLAIAAEIVRLHGGAIWTDGGSAFGGARFCVKLP